MFYYHPNVNHQCGPCWNMFCKVLTNIIRHYFPAQGLFIFVGWALYRSTPAFVKLGVNWGLEYISYSMGTHVAFIFKGYKPIFRGLKTFICFMVFGGPRAASIQCLGDLFWNHRGCCKSLHWPFGWRKPVLLVTFECFDSTDESNFAETMDCYNW